MLTFLNRADKIIIAFVYYFSGQWVKSALLSCDQTKNQI